jgi:peptidoglycan/LPS O-acetylase OafA/YrhL
LLVLAFHLRLLAGGSLGVDLFFVLSGFLITSLLVEEWQQRGSISLKCFYLRRVLRLLPTLLLLCGLSTFLLHCADEARARRREVIVAACYVANWPALHRTAMPALEHTWSLSVEEQFYLLWPVLLYLGLRLKVSRRWLLLLVSAGILGSACLRLGLYRAQPFGPAKVILIKRLYMGLDTRADALLVGCLVGLLATGGRLPRSRRFVFWSRAAALGSAVALGYLAWQRCPEHSHYYQGLFTVVALMAGSILVHLLTVPSGFASAVLQTAPLVGIGRISYGLYLFHMPIIAWLGAAGLGWDYPGNTVLVAGLSLAAALFSYWCLECPCLRLKGRWHARLPVTVANFAEGCRCGDRPWRRVAA